MSRDLRLDICRGWLQLTIFASHALGSWIGAWLIHGAWGLSDSSEQFVFLSGLTLGSVFDHKLSRLGWQAASRDMLWRAARLYRTHLVLLLGFATIVVVLHWTPTLSDEVDQLRWTYWFDHPVGASLAALVLVYQPAFMDILPIFILGMLLLPLFAGLQERVGPLALAAPLLLFASVHVLGLQPPSAGEATGFNPLAWQVLFLVGAALGRALRRGTWTLSRNGLWATLACAILLLGLALRLVQHGFVPWLLPTWLDGWIGKRDLGWLRICHALALTYLIARFVPREAAWMRGTAATLLAAIGRRSLAVFGVGLFLSWGGSLAFRLLPYSLGLDLAVIGGGTGLLAVAAVMMDRPRQLAPLDRGSLATVPAHPYRRLPTG